MEHKTLILIVLVVLGIINLLSFCLMGYDKKRAQQGKWRIPEKTLFGVTACGGGLGGVLGMMVFRHKTKHWYFKLFFPMMLIVQAILLGAWFYLWNR